MGIFDVPRLHVSGRFFADPSSVNNDPDHYLSTNKTPAPWQMPKGRHHFRFENCSVKTAVGKEGGTVTDPAVVGLAMRSTDEPMPGKIVDLDVYQQAVTQLIGVEVLIGDPAGAHLKGKMDTAVLNGNSFKFVQPTRGWKDRDGYGWGSYGGDSNAIGVFQTVIRVAEEDWSLPNSGFWADLRGACDVEAVDGKIYRLLSFKFLLDGYWNVIGSTDYQYGRMTGTIGAQRAGQPRETPGARWLEARDMPENPEWFVPFLYRAPFAVDSERNVLLIDWSGSVPRLSVGGDPVPLGTVTAKVVSRNIRHEIGPVRIDSYVYNMNGAISEVPLTAEQAELLSAAPLELWTSREDIGPQRIFAERADGFNYTTQNRNIRMSSDKGLASSTATATVHITQWGKPVAGRTPQFKIIPISGTTPGITVPPGYPGDTESAKGALGAQLTPSDVNGISTVTFTALKDPGSRTDQLDGQIYFCYAYFDEDKPWKEPRQEAQISVLLWSQYDVIEDADWEQIEPLMVPYQKLYPAMAEKFHLADKRAFDFYANNPPFAFFVGPEAKYSIPGFPDIADGTIPYYVSLPFDHPQYMPITRDLSPNKVRTMLHYIQREQQAAKAKSDAEEKETQSGKD